MLEVFRRCSVREHVLPVRWPIGARRIFWPVEMRPALWAGARSAGSGAKMSGPAAIVSGFSGARRSSWARSSAGPEMAEFCGFRVPRLDLLEALCWKAWGKVLFHMRFPACRISLAGFGACLGRSIGPTRGRPPPCPQRRAAILLHVGTPDWPDLDPVSGARPSGLRRLTFRPCRASGGGDAPMLERERRVGVASERWTMPQKRQRAGAAP